jgi:capsid protein
MKFLTPILAFGFRCVIAAKLIFNRYEAGQRYGTSRSHLPGWVQDARFDADNATREEIMRKARYFEKNSGLVNRLADLFEQFTVGPCGLQLIAASSEEDWNAKAMEKWNEWQKFADLTSLQPFSVLQSLIARRWFIDGEIFIIKTRGSESPSRPRIQLIESHRVRTPDNLSAEEGRRIIDGVEVDGRGRPVAYHIRDGFDEQTFRRVPANQVIHVFEPSRPGEYRGMSFFAAVMNELHDLDDLLLLEMRAAKDAAEKSTFIETASGELRQSGQRAERTTATTQNSSGEDVTVSRTRWLKEMIGGRVAALKMGEKVHQFLSNRPTVSQQWYFDYLTGRITAGVGISKLLVYPFSMQGTVTRADLDVMAGFFRSRSEVLAAAFTEVRNYVMDWETKNEVTLADPPADWRKVTVRAPRSVNVDVGRNSSAMLSELKAGARTYQDVYAELGQDYREQLRQRAKEAKYIRDLAKEFEVTPADISDFAAEAIASMQPPSAKPGKPAVEEEETVVTE